MRRIILGVIAAVVVCGAGFAVLLGGTLFATQGVADAAEAFMVAIDENRLDDAYAMFTPELQDVIAQDDFEEIFAGADLQSWDLSSRSVENNNGTNTGEISGTAQIDDLPHTVEFGFVNQDGWKLLSFDFEPQA